jgi:asparagine synthase (glutamine-hydrolysing)
MRAAIGAIIDLEGGPVEPLEVEHLAAGARLPAGGAAWLVAGPAGGLVAVPAGRGAAPAGCGLAGSDRGGPARYDVVLDGSLDHRAELARELGAPREDAQPAGGPRLVAAAYERWGADCAAHLDGELAFVLWDRRERRLLASGDAFGQRQLFYACDGRRVRVASQLQMLVERPALSEIDEEYAADFLAGVPGYGPATPFKQVRRLEAGHRLSAGGGRLETSRWWFPGEEETTPRRSEGEAVEAFRALLEQAVVRCLGSGGRAWAELSGGLDSSSIVCLAAEALGRDGARAHEFATLTYAWKDSPQCDERRWSDRVVEKYGLENHRVFCDGLFFDDVARECAYRSEPHFGLLASPMLHALGEVLRGSGVEVLLSGARAESVVLADQMAPIHLADTLRGGRLGELREQLVAWHRGTHLPPANLLLSFALQPLLGRRRHPRSILDRGEVNPWLDRHFAARMKVAERCRAARVERRFREVARQHQYEMLVRSQQHLSRGSLEWSLEIRYPFLYRPLVELALAIPWAQKISPVEGKLLLRRAMAGRLPEEVRTRRGGSGPSADLYKTFARRWDAIAPVVESSLLVSMGMIDRGELRRAAELARFGAVDKFVAFLSCLAFEHWLRAVTGGERVSSRREALAAGRAAVGS